MAPLATGFPKPPEPEESLRNAFCRKDGPLGEVDIDGTFSSFLSSSCFSLGEYAAPKGLGASSFDDDGDGDDDVAFGLGWLPLLVDCDGGVDPDENLELRFEIHEFRLIEIGFVPFLWGVVSLAFDSGVAGALSSRAFLFGSDGRAVTGDEVGGGGFALDIVFLSAVEPCRFGTAAGSTSTPDFSLFTDDTDLERER